MTRKFSGLLQFLGPYFHQDWMCESSDPDAIIKFFMLDSTTQTIGKVKEEIIELLALHLAEMELRKFLLDEMACSYCYWFDWESGETWLNHVVEVLSIDSLDSERP